MRCWLLVFAVAAVSVGVAAPARPARALDNDLCDAPSVVSATPFRTTQSTAEATTEVADPLQTCTFGGTNQNTNSVWYSFTAPGDGSVTADTAGSDYDTVLTAYTGTCSALSEIACNDDVGFPDVTSQVSFPVTAGMTYLLEATHSFLAPGEGDSLHFALSFGGLTDANCDGRQTAADLPALVILIAGNDRASCRLDDANGDGVLNAEDTVGTIEAIFELGS